MYAATVNHEESFMIYGGESGSSSSYVDMIYKYNTDGGQWDEMPFTMREKKYGVTAIKIKGSIFNSC